MFSFEKLEVYNKGLDFYSSIHAFLKLKKAMPLYLKNQLGRAALSIPLNIAEGSGKFSLKDRKHFLVIARGSVFECAAILRILYRENEINDDFENEQLICLDEMSRMLYAMIRNLDDRIGT